MRVCAITAARRSTLLQAEWKWHRAGQRERKAVDPHAQQAVRQPGAAHRGKGGTPEGLPEFNPGKQLVAPN
jgi:hypothetical protein